MRPTTPPSTKASPLRWNASALQRHGTAEARAQADLADQRRQDFRDFTLRWRGTLLALYQGGDADAAKRARKAELMAQMRAES